MIICIGPVNGGKTLLLKRLYNFESYLPLDEIPSTIPTVGTNIVNIHYEKKYSVRVHEIGGSIAPIWNSYYNDCEAIIFVIDSSNLQQISCSCIQLLEILTHQMLQNTQVLLLLNKIDIKSSTSLNEIENILRLDDICKYAHQPIHIIKTSCITGKGLDLVKDWLKKFCVQTT